MSQNKDDKKFSLSESSLSAKKESSTISPNLPPATITFSVPVTLAKQHGRYSVICLELTIHCWKITVMCPTGESLCLTTLALSLCCS